MLSANPLVQSTPGAQAHLDRLLSQPELFERVRACHFISFKANQCSQLEEPENTQALQQLQEAHVQIQQATSQLRRAGLLDFLGLGHLNQMPDVQQQQNAFSRMFGGATAAQGHPPEKLF